MPGPNWFAWLLLADVAIEPPIPPDLPEQPVPPPAPIDDWFGWQLPEPTPTAMAGLALCLAVFLTVRVLGRRKKSHHATALALGAAAPVLIATLALVALSHRAWRDWQTQRDEQAAAYQAQSAEYERQSELYGQAVVQHAQEVQRGRRSYTERPDPFAREFEEPVAIDPTYRDGSPAVAPPPDSDSPR